MTALKFAELSVKAGFPKGVINIIPGSGKPIRTYLAVTNIQSRVTEFSHWSLVLT